ncbi:hypothetical protein IGI04_024491, partial [Brassica rapa subsp. trilocularis]
VYSKYKRRVFSVVWLLFLCRTCFASPQSLLELYSNVVVMCCSVFDIVFEFRYRLLEFKMQNEEGQVTELYIPRKCSATNRMITSKDHASVQLNIGHLDADGIYTGQFTTLALCGFVRAQGDADSGVDRLWQKKKVEAKQI